MTLVLLPLALSLAEPPVAAGAPPPAPAATVAADAAAPVRADPPADAARVAPDPATPVPSPAPQPRAHHQPGDPLEPFNRAMFKVNHQFDRLLLRPVALGYKHAVPNPVRSGLRNFFSNLGEPVVFVNDLLQLRIGKAGRTLGRFALNSTLGMGGLFDVAKRKGFHLPHRRNTFGDTLAWYGVGPGPYVFLPVVGPATLRDIVAGPFDDAIIPIAIFSKLARTPFDDERFLVPSAVIPGLDLRAESDAELKALTDGAVDPYASLRSAWLQNRASEVAHMHSPGGAQPQATPELDNPLLDPAAPAPAPATPQPPAQPPANPAPGAQP